MSERLELVTDFGSLRAGMIVVMDCIGHRHRGMLTAFISEGINAPAWRMDPQPTKCTDTVGWLSRGACVGATLPGVAAQIVYRVIDDHEASQETTTEKPRKVCSANTSRSGTPRGPGIPSQSCMT